MTHDAILGFSYDDDGKATIDMTTLRRFAGAKLRRYEPLLETDLDPGVRDVAEVVVTALRIVDALIATTLDLAGELAAERSKPKPAPQQVTRTVFVRDDKDEVGP